MLGDTEAVIPPDTMGGLHPVVVTKLIPATLVPIGQHLPSRFLTSGTLCAVVETEPGVGSAGELCRGLAVGHLAIPPDMPLTVKKVVISLAVGAGALFATAALAAPLANGLVAIPDNGVENVRMVCNEYGRCWRERGQRRVIIQDSYNYAPRERYIERRGYYDGGYYNNGPSVGIGVGPGGVGIGFGAGPRW